MTIDAILRVDMVAERLANSVGLSWWLMTYGERDYWRTVARSAIEYAYEHADDLDAATPFDEEVIG